MGNSIDMTLPEVAVESTPGSLVPEKAEAVSQALSDPVNLALLSVTGKHQRSARQIAHQLDIAQASCYRRLQMLVGLGLIEQVGRQLGSRGRRASCFRSRVNVLRITLEGDRVIIDIDLAPPADDDLTPIQHLRVARRWTPLVRRR